MILTPEQRVSTSETCFDSLVHLKPIKIDCDFVSLLLHSFNPDVRCLKVGCRHILISETDVEEIFSLRSTGLDVPMTWEPRQLEALAAICDLRSEPPKVATLQLLLTQLPPGSEFQRAFILFTIGMLLPPRPSPQPLCNSCDPWSTWTARRLTTRRR